MIVIEAYEFQTGDVVEFRERLMGRGGMLAERGAMARVIDATGGKVDVQIENDAARLESVAPALLRLAAKGREEAVVSSRLGRIEVEGRGGELAFPAALAAVSRVGRRVDVVGAGCRAWFDLPDDDSARALSAALLALLSGDGAVTQRVRLGSAGLAAHGFHSAPAGGQGTRSRIF